MKKYFTDRAWEDYTYWQKENPKMLVRINELIKDIERNGNKGLGKPEPLIGNLKGLWSRRIDDKHRLVYSRSKNELLIYSCRYHYNDH